MTRFALEINSRQETVDADPEMPLLWALRDLLNMTGTKYACGIGLCGACLAIVRRGVARSEPSPHRRPRSTRPWPEISAVAPLTSAFAVLSAAPQRRPGREHQTQPCAGKKQRRHLPTHLPRKRCRCRRSICRRPHPSRPSSPCLF